jgi:hypothetical protein
MSIFDAGAFGSGQVMSFACRLAEQVPGFYGRHRRFLRFVDTHQKWLLVHLIADTCAGSEPIRGQDGAAVNWIVDRAGAQAIASRNTTLAFLGQLAAYGYIERRHCSADRRIRLVTLSPETRTILADWALLLQRSAVPDRIDEEDEPELAWLHYLAIAAILLDRPGYLAPPVDVRLTQEMRGGWLVMNHLLSLVEPAEAGLDRVAACDFNAPACARTFGLSRSTVYRLLRLAAEAGLMGSGAEAQIPFFWLSGHHVRQHCRWNGHLLQAVQAACGSTGLSEAMPKKSPEIPCGTVPAIRAPATTFI